MGSYFGKQGIGGLLNFGKKGFYANILNDRGVNKSLIRLVTPSDSDGSGMSGGQTAAVSSPSVRDASSDPNSDANQDPERLKRIGRASLITSSSRGVLDTGDTSNRKLFGV